MAHWFDWIDLGFLSSAQSMHTHTLTLTLCICIEKDLGVLYTIDLILSRWGRSTFLWCDNIFSFLFLIYILLLSSLPLICQIRFSTRQSDESREKRDSADLRENQIKESSVWIHITRHQLLPLGCLSRWDLRELGEMAAIPQETR
jgi:hypothetical protein